MTKIPDMIRNFLVKTIVFVIAVLTAAFSSNNFLAEAIPTSGKIVKLYQPDGSILEARLCGDEFLKLYTTLSGEPVIQDSEGYYRIDTEAPSLVQRMACAKRKRLSGKAHLYNKETLLKRVAQSKPVLKGGSGPITKHGIVILAEFADIPFRYTKKDFTDMLTKPGYSENGATGSAIDYFNDQFKGKFQFSFEVSDIVRLKYNCAHYGANLPDGSDKAATDMIVEACVLADKTIDFSKYDDDGDGVVDNVFVFFSGYDEAEGTGAEKIWSHAWYITEDGHNITLDNKKIDRYACTAELSVLTGNKLAGIGTFCHEFSHTLDLDDYYDTDYEGSGGWAEALWGSTALMDGGNANNRGMTPPNYNAIDREMSGLSSAEVLKPGKYTLEPIDVGGRYLRIDTDNRDEYFLIECRSNKNWDKYIGGSGMLIYHIDRSDANAGYSEIYDKELSARERWIMNEINCRPDRQCADLIEAVSGTNDVSSIFFPAKRSASDNFTPDTDPAFRSWSDKASPLSLTDIRMSGNSVTFTVVESASHPNLINVTGKEIYQDAIILTWDTPEAQESTDIVLKIGNTVLQNITASSYSPGHFSHTLENLSPGTSYTVSLSASGQGASSATEQSASATTFSFTTKSQRNNALPFIYLNYVERNPDKTFPKGTKLPLRLFNASDAEGIVWYMDDIEVQTSENGYYTPQKSGMLKAEILYKDGTRGFVCKKIELR